MGTPRMLLLVLAGCSDASTTAPPIDGVDGQRGACTAFEGRTFESVDLHECGLTPNGASMCRWRLSFEPIDAQRTMFSWQHSDVGENGAVRCTGRQITTDGIGNVYTGAYDATTRRLTWDGVPYAVTPS
jgi:hypothetical protein